MCVQEGIVEIIHRRHCCDSSLFQLGLGFLDHFLNEILPTVRESLKKSWKKTKVFVHDICGRNSLIISALTVEPELDSA
jgi:hypothetical protein